MNLRTLPYTTGLVGYLREILYSLTRMAEDSFAAPLAPKFEALRTEWKNVQSEELDILEGIARTDAGADKVDSQIDLFATKVSRIIDDNTSGPTRKKLRLALFKGKPLSKFTRPILGQQLTSMTDWGTTFTESGIPQLVALVPEHTSLMTLANEANDKRNAAQKRNRDFRDVGQRKQFVDKLNARRQEAAGVLAKLAFEQPGLPSGYADGFFVHEAPRDDEPTIDEVKTAITTLETNLAEQKTLLKKLEEDAEAERQADLARAAQAAEAEQLEAQAKALLAQAAELKKHAGKK